MTSRITLPAGVSVPVGSTLLLSGRYTAVVVKVLSATEILVKRVYWWHRLGWRLARWARALRDL